MIIATSTMNEIPLLSSSAQVAVNVGCTVHKVLLEKTPLTMDVYTYKMDKKMVIPMPKYSLFPPCKRTILYHLENHTSGYNLKSYPSFMSFNSETNEVVLDKKNVAESGRLYTFTFVVEEDLGNVVNSEYTFTIKVPENTAPKFNPDLTKQTLQAGIESSLKLPPLTDLENDEIQSFFVKLGAAGKFMNYNPSRS